MKKLMTMLCIAISLTVAGCGSSSGGQEQNNNPPPTGGDNSGDTSPVKPEPTKELQGKIGGKSWQYASARFTPSPFEDGTENLSIISKDVDKDSICEIDYFQFESSDKMQVIFGSAEVKKGKVELGLSSGKTVTLIDGDGEANNYIAFEGSVKFSSVSASKVKGQISARADKDSFIAGTFEAYRCCSKPGTLFEYELCE